MKINPQKQLQHLFSAIMMFSFYSAYGFSFQVTGTYKSSTPDANGVWQVQQELPFVVTVRNSEWAIRLDYGPDWYEYYASNGTNVFHLLHHPENPPNAMPGAIMEDIYPVNGTPHATLLWLAFCSTRALDQGMALPASWADARRTPLAYLYEMELERYPEPLSLPVHIRYITTAERMKSAVRGRYLLREKLSEQDKHLRSFDYEAIAGNGVLGSEYKVLEAANHNGIVVPWRFELIFYDHLSGSSESKSKLVPKIRYEGMVATVTNIAETGSLLPAIDRRIDIVDYRLKHEKPIDYIVFAHHGNYWPEVITDEMRSNLAERAAFSLTATLDRALSVRTIFIGLIALAIFLPPIIKVMVRRQKYTKTRNTANRTYETKNV